MKIGELIWCPNCSNENTVACMNCKLKYDTAEQYNYINKANGSYSSSTYFEGYKPITLNRKEFRMEKYKSDTILEKDIKIETNTYYEDDLRHEAVRLTHIPSGLNVTYVSQKGQINAYNLAIKSLEKELQKEMNS